MNIVLEDVDCCPVCGGQGTHDISFKEPEYGIILRMFSCKECDTVYHNPRMSQNSMIEYYQSGDYRSSPERAIDKDRAILRMERLAEMIDGFSYYRPTRCLDVGCSRGYLSRILHDKFDAEVVGYDVYHDPEAVIEIVDSKDAIAGKFDLITCIHVLEHFADPLKELEWMAGLLTDDGMLVVEIPFIRKVMVPHPVIFSRKAVPLLAKHIDGVYILIESANSDNGVVFIKKGCNGFNIAVR